MGRQTVENLLQGKFGGNLWAINPNYDAVCGVPCYASLADLPATVEHVIFAVGDARVEAALDEAIAHGARAATIMSSLVLREDEEPALTRRVADKIRRAGLIVCGGNGMGFYNFRDGVWACGFDTRDTHRAGNIAFISHSGSGMAGIVDVDERLDFNLVVSTGQELSVSMDEYLDYALELPGTQVVGLFMETARNPAAMMAALEKANRLRIPVVALKVGRTELSARLAVSHSGAIAGNHAAYEALFDRYGVQCVDDMDELATTLIMFAQPHPVAAGGLVAIHDSGGERQLLIDRARALDVPLAEVGKATAERLENLLDPGLPPVNPLDAWGAGGPDADRIMADAFAALTADDAAAIGAVVHDRAPGGAIYDDYRAYLRAGHDASGKPVFLVANRQGTGTDPAVLSLTREGFPVLDGLSGFLRGVKCLFGYRDFLARPEPRTADHATGKADKWRARLHEAGALDELQSSELLADLGVSINPLRYADSQAAVMAAAGDLEFPLVLKTAAPGITHKTEHNGVRLNLRDADELSAAYQDMASRLGPQVLLAPMIRGGGVEMMLGMTRDEQFGNLLVIGFGGVNAELVRDVVYALPPVDTVTARRLVDRLRLRRLLDGYRGAGPAALDSFCEMIARFSGIVTTLGDVITEIDMNPVIVDGEGCKAVDALVVGNAN